MGAVLKTAAIKQSTLVSCSSVGKGYVNRMEIYK
jgi:hypothetical protein